MHQSASQCTTRLHEDWCNAARSGLDRSAPFAAAQHSRRAAQQHGGTGPCSRSTLTSGAISHRKRGNEQGHSGPKRSWNFPMEPMDLLTLCQRKTAGPVLTEDRRRSRLVVAQLRQSRIFEAVTSAHRHYHTLWFVVNKYTSRLVKRVEKWILSLERV